MTSKPHHYHFHALFIIHWDLWLFLLPLFTAQMVNCVTDRCFNGIESKSQHNGLHYDVFDHRYTALPLSCIIVNMNSNMQCFPHKSVHDNIIPIRPFGQSRKDAFTCLLQLKSAYATFDCGYYDFELYHINLIQVFCLNEVKFNHKIA